MTTKMMETLKTAGIASEWHKGNMHRMYIDLAKADELYSSNCDSLEHARLNLNRFDRNNGKMWIDLETGEIKTKNIGFASDVINQIMELVAFLTPAEETEEEATEEEAEETAEIVETDYDLFELCKAAHVKVDEDRNIRVPISTPAKLVEAIKARKNEIVEAMSGYCFSHDVYMGREQLGEWKIMKRSNISEVNYPHVEIFSGTALEVDEWAKKHSKDPFFSNKYTSKYYYTRVRS